jgi:UDP-N-acetylglucosamine 2-epimerase
MKKIITVVGARPQFIKLAPLSKEIREKYLEVIVHTGQHYNDNMSMQFFRDLEMNEPDHNLGIGSGSHGVQTGKMLVLIEDVFIKEKPDLVIVFGDTNSTLAGALAAAKMNIPLAHVEAGLRSFNRQMPEEINRVAADHISDFLFAPTETAAKNLESEGLKEKSFLTGDIMVDTLKRNLSAGLRKSNILKTLKLTGEEYMLLTLHRPYNVDNPDKLGKILNLLSQLDLKIFFPVHPRTRKIILKYKIPTAKNIILIEPLGYLDFICLEKNAKKIITDSGGIQKEAYILEKPCITIRPETEWIETVRDGWNILLDLNTDPGKFLDMIRNFKPKTTQTEIFGKNVAERMVLLIEGFLD